MYVPNATHFGHDGTQFCQLLCIHLFTPLTLNSYDAKTLLSRPWLTSFATARWHPNGCSGRAPATVIALSSRDHPARCHDSIHAKL
ncbi:hypothetical protein DMI62_05145 [Escherichia coli]|nr:hypothetical protein [Escherichia coli]